MENVSTPPTDVFIDAPTRNSPRDTPNAASNASDARYPETTGHSLTHGHSQTYHATHGGDSSGSPRLRSRRFNPYFGSTGGLTSASATPSSSPLHGPSGQTRAIPTSGLLGFPATLPVVPPQVQPAPLPGQEVLYPQGAPIQLQYVPSVYGAVPLAPVLLTDGLAVASAPAVVGPPMALRVPVPARWASDPGPLTANTIATASPINYDFSPAPSPALSFTPVGSPGGPFSMSPAGLSPSSGYHTPIASLSPRTTSAMFSLAVHDEELSTALGWGHGLNGRSAHFNNAAYPVTGQRNRSGSGYGHGQPYGHGETVSVSSLLADHGSVATPVSNKPLGMGILPSPLSAPQLRSANDVRRGYRSKTLADTLPQDATLDRGGLGDTKAPSGGHAGRVESLGEDEHDGAQSRNDTVQTLDQRDGVGMGSAQDPGSTKGQAQTQTLSISTAFHPVAHASLPPPDLIIVSADDTLFYVHVSKVAAASPVFMDLLTTHARAAEGGTIGTVGALTARDLFLGPLPSPPPQNWSIHVHAGRPSPTKSVEGQIHTPHIWLKSTRLPADQLNVILHAIYNTTCAAHQPSIDTLEQAVDALLPEIGTPASELVTPESELFAYILRQAPLHPLRVYALGAHHGMHELAVRASGHLLSYSLSSLTDKEAERIGAVYLRKLVLLLVERTAKLRDLLLRPPRPHPPTKRCGFREQKTVEGLWAMAIVGVAWDVRPDLSTSFLQRTLEPVKSRLECPVCRECLDARIKDVLKSWASVNHTIA